LSIAEPTAAGNLISPEQFKEFVVPHLKKITLWAHSQSTKVLLHICGNTSDRLELIKDIDVDCFSVDSKVSLKVAKEVLVGRVCLAGNVDPVNVLAKGTVNEVRNVTEKCLADAAEKGGYILMPGCDLPPNVPEENIKTFLEIGRTWKYE
jgi:uroporphyrinogen decarboxylase